MRRSRHRRGHRIDRPSRRSPLRLAGRKASELRTWLGEPYDEMHLGMGAAARRSITTGCRQVRRGRRESAALRAARLTTVCSLPEAISTLSAGSRTMPLASPSSVLRKQLSASAAHFRSQEADRQTGDDGGSVRVLYGRVHQYFCIQIGGRRTTEAPPEKIDRLQRHLQLRPCRLDPDAARPPRGWLRLDDGTPTSARWGSRCSTTRSCRFSGWSFDA